MELLGSSLRGCARVSRADSRVRSGVRTLACVTLAFLLVLSPVVGFIGLPSPIGTAEADPESTSSAWIEDAEEGTASDAYKTVTSDPEGDGIYDFTYTQSYSSYSGSKALYQRLEGYGGNANYEWETPVDRLNAEEISFAFNASEVNDANTNGAGYQDLLVKVKTTTGEVHTIHYRTATAGSATTDASVLRFVVKGHNEGKWTHITRNVTEDLNSGGFADAETIIGIGFEASVPGSGGGSDIVGVLYDDIEISDGVRTKDAATFSGTFIDYESGNLNQWETKTTSSGATYSGVGTIEDSQQLRGSYSHKMEDTGGEYYNAYHRLSNPAPPSLAWEVSTTTDSDGTVRLVNSTNASLVHISKAEDGSTNMWTVRTDGGTQDLVTSTGHDAIAIENIDYSARTYDVRINDEVVATGLSLQANGEITAINVKEEFDSGTTIYDSWSESFTWDNNPTTTSGGDISGQVVTQSGSAVPNATVQVWAVSDSISLPSGESYRERAAELLDDASNPIPDAFVRNQDFATLSKESSATQVLVHKPDDWLSEAGPIETHFGYQQAGKGIHAPVHQMQPEREHIISCWDLSASDGLFADAIDSGWKGVTTSCTVTVERIGPSGDVISSAKLSSQELFETRAGIGGKRHHAIEFTPPEAGIYRITAEGSPVETWVHAGDLRSLARTFEEDMRNRAGQLSERANEIAQYRADNVFTKISVEADSQGRFSADVPAGYSLVDVTAFKGTIGGQRVDASLSPDNRSLADIRERFETEMQQLQEGDYSTLDDASSNLGSVYVSTSPARTSVPAQNVTVEVRELSAPGYSNLSDYQSWMDKLNGLIANESYSELQSFLTDSLTSYDNERIREQARSMLGVVEQNEELNERTEELLSQNEQLSTSYEEIKERIESESASREEMIALLRAQQQAAAEQASTINSLRDTIQSVSNPTESGEPSLLNLKVPFGGALSEEGTTVLVHWSNGSTTQMSSDYWSISDTAAEDITGSATHDFVVIEDYPLSPDAAVANIQVLTAGEDGFGKRKVRVSNPAFEGDVPEIQSFNFNSLRPAAGSEVQLGISPSEESTFSGLKSATVINTETGQQLPVNVSGSSLRFTPAEAGSHLLKLELSSSSGQAVVETLRLKVGSADVSMPAAVRIQEGITGRFAVAGDGVERASIKQQGDSLSVGAVFDSESTAGTLHVYAGELQGSASDVTVRALTGEDEQSGRQMEVVLHTSGLSEDAHLYRGTTPITEEGTSAGQVTRNVDGTVIRTYTDESGAVSLSYDNDPGIVDNVRWWVRTNLPQLPVQAPPLPSIPLSGTVSTVEISLPELTPALGGFGAVTPGVGA